MHNRRYISGLDGLRAFAILSVIFYHFSFSWAKGGFLGVDIFFVLSGYLVTSKILLSRENFELKTFWKGRLCRLLPSAYLMIMITSLGVIFFDHRLLTNLLGDVLSSISYTTNWWFIFHKLSYFDSFGSPSPLKHIWFLAVQEQFYILWPLILVVVLRNTKKTKKISSIIFIGALLSATLMGILYDPAADPSRIYYGTDTRAFELLIGSFLASISVNKKPFTKEVSKKQRNELKLLSIITFSIFIFSTIFIDEYNSSLYRGGLFLFSLNTALLIACVCHPKGILGPILSWKPLRWIGTRSYGIYLWHYPIMVLSTPIYEIGNPSYLRVFIQLIITCIIAELSYHFIEMPIRKGGFRKYYNYLTVDSFKRNSSGFTKKTVAIISVLVIISLSIGINNMVKIKSNLKKAEAYSPEIETNTAEIPEDKDADENPNEKDINISTENDEETSSTEEEDYKEILAIGDSIMLDITPKLNKTYSSITIDGKIGRQMSEAIDLATKYAEFNNSDKAVIIELGTNGYFTSKQIDELLDSFSKSHVFLVNTRVPRSWESKVNKVLKEKAEERENVTLIDWYAIASEHPEYFDQDGVHLNPEGTEALVSLISESLRI
ncbi:acyltransferase family protein [Tissierella praeacuta]|uniref:acyltransferase family protein n=1 Tax=Tissierella praeacuta TaxID=43131 RepID=UPI00333FCA17